MISISRAVIWYVQYLHTPFSFWVTCMHDEEKWRWTKLKFSCLVFSTLLGGLFKLFVKTWTSSWREAGGGLARWRLVFAQSAQQAICIERPITLAIKVKKHVWETWIQCTQCFSWVHESCLPIGYPWYTLYMSTFCAQIAMQTGYY